MTVIDIITLLVLAFALYDGLRNGLVVQLCSLAGIAIGIWCGTHYGAQISNVLNITGEYSAVWGFVIVLIVALILIAIGSRLLRGVLRLAGLGVVDVLLGMVLSVVKYLIILSIIFSLFNAANDTFGFVDKGNLASSKLYYPILEMTDWMTPAWDWTKDQINSVEKL